MKTATLLIVSAAWFTGCAAPSMHAAKTATPETKKHATTDDSAKPGDIDETYDNGKTTPATAPDPRKVGDYVVFSFDGSYRKAGLMLTERVVARTDDAITLELVFAEKGKPLDTLHVTTSLAVGHVGDVQRVETKNDKGAFVAAPTSTYDNLMAMTVASVDENDEQVSRVAAKTTVGNTALEVEKTTYRVRIGKAAATMQTLSSETFAWGDVGGEIRADGGALVYSAKLVDMGTNPSTVASIDAPASTN